MAHVIQKQQHELYKPVKDTILTKYWFITSRLSLYFLKATLWLSFMVAAGLLLGWLLSGESEFDSVNLPALAVNSSHVSETTSAFVTSTTPTKQLSNGKEEASCQNDINAALQQQSFLFATGSTRLNQSSKTFAQHIAAILQRCSDITINVVGHTDNKGNEAANKRLSELRAKSVAKALEQHGIQASQIKTEGLGSAHPVATNSTTEGRANNRRIEIQIHQQK